VIKRRRSFQRKNKKIGETSNVSEGRKKEKGLGRRVHDEKKEGKNTARFKTTPTPFQGPRRNAVKNKKKGITSGLFPTRERKNRGRKKERTYVRKKNKKLHPT